MTDGYKSSHNVVGQKYTCINCDYNTSKVSNYNKHLLTAKHLKITNGDNKVAKSSLGSFDCICGNKYKHRQGLNRHKSICIYELPKTDIEIQVNTTNEPAINQLTSSMFIDIIKENQEFKNLLIEQSKQFMEQNNILINKLAEKDSIIATINSNNTTNNNQKFNLNFFLNETCKDAMSIQEFIENIRITFEDLLTIGNGGFVNGVSDILIKQLRDLEINKRPIHCTDAKRETIYLREEAAWNKDDKEKTKLKQLIEKVEYKNVAALHNWCNENPDARVNNTPNNILKDKIFYQTLQGDERTRDKIIKNLTKEVVVEKEQ